MHVMMHVLQHCSNLIRVWPLRMGQSTLDREVGSATRMRSWCSIRRYGRSYVLQYRGNLSTGLGTGTMYQYIRVTLLTLFCVTWPSVEWPGKLNSQFIVTNFSFGHSVIIQISY